MALTQGRRYYTFFKTSHHHSTTPPPDNLLKHLKIGTLNRHLASPSHSYSTITSTSDRRRNFPNSHSSPPIILSIAAERHPHPTSATPQYLTPSNPAS
jgi:hypothetical protein